MDVKAMELSPQIKALQSVDLSPMIGVGGLLVPRMLGVFLPTLNQKQRNAFDKVMPVGGKKKFYVKIVGSPTPYIVMEMAQPMKMSVMQEDEVKNLGIKGIKMTPSDLQAASERKMGKLLWSLKGQLGSLMSISGIFMPIVLLGPGEIKDLIRRAMTHFKPLLDLMPQ